MDWLTKLPVIGPAAAWLFRTRLWRTYLHLTKRKWSRLAAAITFSSALALFPLIVLGAAVGAALLSHAQMNRLQSEIARQIPGISDRLNLQTLVDNAGTVGFVAAVSLLVTGVSWAGTLRESLRSLWDLEEAPGNPLLLKLKDLGTLAGLGAVGLLSLAGSGFALSAVSWAGAHAGLTHGGVGTVLLSAAGYVVAVAVDFGLLWYVLTMLPGVRPPRRAVFEASLLGAVGFEVLKLALGGYLQGVAAKSQYGAFGVPIALLLWISFMTKLLLVCSAWTLTSPTSKPIEAIDALGGGAPEPSESERAAPAPESEQREPGAGTERPDEPENSDEPDESDEPEAGEERGRRDRPQSGDPESGD